MKQNKQQATVIYISETSYGDNTCWITYEIGDKVGYDIVDEAVAKSYKIGDKILVNKKPSLSICSPELSNLIEDCHSSDNEMLFVEEGEMDDSEVFKIQDEVLALDEKYSNLELSDHITFGEDDCLITVYGGVSTLFEF